MKRLTKSKLSLFRFFSLIFVSLAFISCGNLFENDISENAAAKEQTQATAEKPEDIDSPENPAAPESPVIPENKNFILTGSMVLDGAMPQFEPEGAADDASRSAIPLLSSSAVEYFVYAVDGDGNKVNGDFGSDENAKTFSIPLLFGKTWTITCGMRNRSGSKEEFLTASSTPKTYTSSNYTDPLVLYPVPAASGKGEIELSISYPSSISNVTVVCEGSNRDDWNNISVAITPGSGDANSTAVIKTGDTEEDKIPSGVYKINIGFYKGSELVYQLSQSVNVFYGLKTNLWYDAGATGSASPIKSDGSFEITESHLKLFKATNFYVGRITGAENPSDSNIGSHKAPFETLARALSQIETYGLPENDYKIHISEIVFPETDATSGFEITSDFDSKMKSLTLMGVNDNTTDIITGDNRFRALTINSSKKITIKNLTITGGNATIGAGIYYNGTEKLVIDNCIIKDNNATQSGGAIHSSGTVEVLATEITDNTVQNVADAVYINSGTYTMSGGKVNSNISGIGDSEAILVKKDAVFNFYSGEIKDNGCRAIYNHGTVNMTGGTISGHSALRGGAIYNNGSLNISGGIITGNTAPIEDGIGGNGGAIYVAGADTSVTPNVIPSLEITGGTITANTAEAFGGAIFNASKVTIAGGEISGNYITKTGDCGGGAIAVYSETIIKDDAYIPAGVDGKNDIFLYDSGDYLTKHRVYIGSSLTQAQTIKLTPKIYSDNRPMIELAASSTADLAVEYTKFAAGPDEGGYNYTISNAGLLKADLSGLVNKNVTGSSFAGTSTISESEVFVSGRSFAIRPLKASDHEVTQGEYETYCIYSGSGTEIPNVDVGKGCFYPVYYVSWYDAIVYCNLRTIAEMGIDHCVYSIGGEKDPSQWDGKTAGTGANAGKYCGPISTERNEVWDTVTMDPAADGWRLPVEAEWEYLAREGKLTGEQYTYSGNNNIDNVAYYKGSPETKNGTKAHEVKGKTANDLGLYDMTGNVFEWVWDWFTSPLDSAITYQGPTYAQANSGKEKVFCGGAYSKIASDCKLNKRGWYQPPHLRFGDIGFRVVRGALSDSANMTTTPLTLEAEVAGAMVTFTNKAAGDVTYKVNGGETQTIETGNVKTITLDNAGDKVQFFGDNSKYGASGATNSSTISCSDYCYIYGNIMSLVNSTDFASADTLLGTYTFANLFNDNDKIKNKDDTALLLPARTLETGCYRQMFKNCSSLTTAPELPATTMVKSCYSAMFSGCTNLTIAPTLPATTLSQNCYSDMFYGCNNLTTAPELPATTLASGCYYSMFRGCENLAAAPDLPATTLAETCYCQMFYSCSKLTEAPELPATTLKTECYQEMFRACTSLNKITCLATDISATDCTKDWVIAVASNGTFTQAPGAIWSTGKSGIPSSWTVTGVNWIGSKTPYQTKVVGDIVFTDGSASSYTELASLTDDQKAAAIALIFYKGSDCNDEGVSTPRTLGVGLKHNKDGIRWCRSETDENSANAFNLNITTIQCSVSGDAGALTITGDKNGSDNLEQIAAFLTANGSSDDTGTDENYPAFYFAKNYKNMEGSRVNGTAFADNWYLPSIAELYQIHLCIKDTMNGFNIDEASDALGGDKFTTSAYRSSSQCVESDNYVCHLYISTGMYRASIKAGSAGYICVIREF